jgi:hypothetical protein
MFDLEEIENKESPLISRLSGLSNEIEVREVLMDEVKYISGLNQLNWEIEKLAIMKQNNLTEAKLDKIRKTAMKVQVVEDNDIEQAREKMKRIMCLASTKGYNYMCVDGKDLRPMPAQEMTPLVKLIAEENKLEESNIYERIHKYAEIEKIVTHIMPSGKTHYSMAKLDNGKYEAVCHVSIEEMIQNQLKKVAHIEVISEFKELIKEHYSYMFDIYEYALAIKFVFEKSNCIWLREHSDTGKTFFLGARESKDYIFVTHAEVKENDFVGDGPERWGKMLFFFIDEATKFSADMKNASLPYRMNYGGRVELDKPLQILSSDNEISDLTQGVDKQIDNRVINIHYQGKFNFRKWLDSSGLDASTAQYMWQKMIFTFILEKLKSWENSESLQKVANKSVVEFKKKYKTSNMKDIKDLAKDLVFQAISECINSEGQPVKAVTKNNRDFKDFLIKDTGRKYHIKSPKTFFSMVLEEYAPEKKKSFFKKYPNNEALASIFNSSYMPRKIEGASIKTLTTSQLPVFKSAGNPK